MKLLLAFFVIVLLLAARTTRRGRDLRAWPLVVASLLVAAGFFSRRVI